MSTSTLDNQSISLDIKSVLTRTLDILTATDYFVLLALALITTSTIVTYQAIGLKPPEQMGLLPNLLRLISMGFVSSMLHYAFNIAGQDPQRSLIQSFKYTYLKKNSTLATVGIFLVIYIPLIFLISSFYFKNYFFSIQILFHITLLMILCSLIFTFEMRYKTSVHSIKEAVRYLVINFSIFSRYWILLLMIGATELFFYTKIPATNLNLLDIYFTAIFLINLFLFILVNVFLERALTKYPPVITSF